MRNPLVEMLNLKDSYGINIGHYQMFFKSGLTNPISGIIGLISNLILIALITIFSLVFLLVKTITDADFLLGWLSNLLQSVLDAIHGIVPPIVLAALGFAVVLTRFTAPKVLGYGSGSNRFSSIEVFNNAGGKFKSRLEQHDQGKFDYTDDKNWKNFLENLFQASLIFVTILFLSANPLKWLVTLLDKVANIGSTISGSGNATNSFLDILAPLVILANYGGDDKYAGCTNAWISAVQSGSDTAGQCTADGTPMSLLLIVFTAIVFIAYTYYLFMMFSRGSLFLAYTIWDSLSLPYRLGWQMFKPDFSGNAKKWYDKMIDAVYDAAVYLAFYLLCVFLMTSVPVIVVNAAAQMGVSALISYIVLTAAFYFGGKNAYRIGPKTDDDHAQSWGDLMNRIVVRNDVGSIDFKATASQALTGEADGVKNFVSNLNGSDSGVGGMNSMTDTQKKVFVDAMKNSIDNKFHSDLWGEDASAENIMKAMRTVKADKKNIDKARDKVNRDIRRGRITTEEGMKKLKKLDEKEQAYDKLIAAKENWENTKEDRFRMVPIPDHLKGTYFNENMLFASQHEIDEAERKLSEEWEIDGSLLDPDTKTALSKYKTIKDAENKLQEEKGELDKLAPGTDAAKKKRESIKKLEAGIKKASEIRDQVLNDPGDEKLTLYQGVIMPETEAKKQKSLDEDNARYIQYAATLRGAVDDKGQISDDFPKSFDEISERRQQLKEEEKAARKSNLTEDQRAEKMNAINKKRQSLDEAESVLSLAFQERDRGVVLVESKAGRLTTEAEAEKLDDIIDSMRINDDKLSESDALKLFNYFPRQKEIETELSAIRNRLAQGGVSEDHKSDLEAEAKKLESERKGLKTLRNNHMSRTGALVGTGDAYVQNPDYDPENPESPRFIKDIPESEQRIREISKQTGLAGEVVKDYLARPDRSESIEAEVRKAREALEKETSKKGDKDQSKILQLEKNLASRESVQQRLEDNFAKVQEALDNIAKSTEDISPTQAESVDVKKAVPAVSPKIEHESPIKSQARAVFQNSYNTVFSTLTPLTSVAANINAHAASMPRERIIADLLPTMYSAVNRTSEVLKNINNEQLQAQQQEFKTSLAKLSGENPSKEDLLELLSKGSLFVTQTAQEVSADKAQQSVAAMLEKQDMPTAEDFNPDTFSISDIIDSASPDNPDPDMSQAEIKTTVDKFNTAKFDAAVEDLQKLIAESAAPGVETASSLYTSTVEDSTTELQDQDTGFASGEATSNSATKVATAIREETEYEQAGPVVPASNLTAVTSQFSAYPEGRESDAVVIETTTSGSVIRDGAKTGFEG